jgi:copper transport protein
MHRLLLFFTVFIAGVLLRPAAASAHVSLLGSAPAASAHLVVAPTEIRLIFSERPERGFTSIVLLGPGGAEIALDSIVIGPGNVASARVAGQLTAGLHVVRWRTVSRDGHPVRGEFDFSVAEGAAGVAAPVDTLSASPQREAIQPLSPAKQSPDFAPFATVLRWLTLVGVIAAVGAVAFRYLIVSRLERAMDEDVRSAYVGPLVAGAVRFGARAAAVVVGAGFLRLVVQMHATETAGAGVGTVASLVGTTMWGRAWLIHMVGGVVAVGGFLLAMRGRERAWIAAGIGAVGMTLGLALSGHAVGVPLATAAVAGHVVHTLAASGWLGVLLVITAVALPLSFRLQRDDRWRIVADVVHVFSPVALGLAASTVLAGVFIAWAQLPSLQALWTTEYGGVLLTKLAFVGLTLAIGAYNWRRVRPTLGEMPGARRLRRSAAVELGFAAMVIAVTAVLLATPIPPH